MKALAVNVLTSVVLLFVVTAGREPLPIDQTNNRRTVTFATDGEDATSAFYYFFYSLPDADEVSKVRMLWNGGATNRPTITDYYLAGSFIWIIERTAERRDLPLLLKGKDARFQTVSERVIKTAAIESERLYVFPAVPKVLRLSEAERKDLTTLLTLLSKTRKPIADK
ncbi:MAG: hypothetical protein DME65_05465 [Verrucomicrobia bacterium]|nr:MAG: hypothetical protein DME65_05465 [Verrucomicrobiota bacterium]